MLDTTRFARRPEGMAGYRWAFAVDLPLIRYFNSNLRHQTRIHVRRHSLSTGNSPKHRQHHSALRQYGYKAASRETSGLYAGG